MTNVIVALSKLDDAKNIKNILVRNGISVTGITTTGAQALSQADGLHDGILICGYKLADMMYDQLQECLPNGFEMLLLASQAVVSECYGNNIVCLSMPLKVHDLIDTVNMMSDNIERRRRRKRLQPKVRTPEEEADIRAAKALLMERNHMTEEEAHRYLQKSSMDSGTNMAEAAQMVLTMLSK
ncbi:MAG: ANTAR domain-containing protein [Lachnospiraceae bacterium]|nr:ANTAR domain-containing protein [Lachnospiraceae bacterium]